jgi:hypothetical protein
MKYKEMTPEQRAAALAGLRKSWSKFYDVADIADEISLSRPFYPRRSSSTARQIHLLEAHGCRSIEDLLIWNDRSC